MLLERLLSFADGSWASRFTLDLVGHSWPDLLQNPYASRVFDSALKALTRSEVGTWPVERFFGFRRGVRFHFPILALTRISCRL